jgi:hypothetical protein
METLVKAIAKQKITVGGVQYLEGSEVEMTQQRFESYLSIGAVQATSQAPIAITDQSIPKYLGIEEPKPISPPAPPVIEEEF